MRIDNSGSFINNTQGNISGGKCNLPAFVGNTILGMTKTTCSTTYVIKVKPVFGSDVVFASCKGDDDDDDDEELAPAAEIAFRIRITSGFLTNQEG